MFGDLLLSNTQENLFISTSHVIIVNQNLDALPHVMIVQIHRRFPAFENPFPLENQGSTDIEFEPPLVSTQASQY